MAKPPHSVVKGGILSDARANGIISSGEVHDPLGTGAYSDLSSLVCEAGEPVHQAPPKAWMSCTDAVIRRVKRSMAILSAGNAAACATTTSRYVVTPPL